MSRQVYVIRHADPNRADTSFVYHELPGPGITECGHRQAQHLAEVVSTYGVKHIYVSPFTRTREMAAPIAARLGIEPIFSDHLVEAAGGKPSAAVTERLQRFLDETAHITEPMIVVTHGVPTRTLLHIASSGALDFLALSWSEEGNPTPVAGIWLLRQETPQSAWQCEFIFQPQQNTTKPD